MPVIARRAALLSILVLASAARAREPRAAIAPIAVGQDAPPEVQRAFQDELPRALAATGIDLVAPNEIDLRVSERPELLRCTAGGCLAEEAAFLRVQRLVLPRLDSRSDGVGVALSLYDAVDKQAIAESVASCAQPCGAASVRAAVREAATQLRKGSLKPGTLEVRATPPAHLVVDGNRVGTTPWRGALPPGDHMVTFEAGGTKVERDVAVAPGRTAHLEVTLDVPTVPAPVAAHPRTRFRVVKWVLFAGALALGGAGAGVWAIDGRGTCALPAGQLECPQVYDTIGTGATLVGLGGAFLITSVLMLALDKPLPPVQVGVSATGSGAALSATGRF